MEGLRNGIFQYFKKKSLLRASEIGRKVIYTNPEDVKSCLVICTGEGKREKELNALSAKIKNAKIDVLYYTTRRKGMPEMLPGTIVFSDDILGFRGKISHEGVVETLATEYDWLLDLTEKPMILTDYLINQSRALCKIGREKSGAKTDIVITGAEEPLDFIDKLTKVLSKINRG